MSSSFAEGYRNYKSPGQIADSLIHENNPLDEELKQESLSGLEDLSEHTRRKRLADAGFMDAWNQVNALSGDYEDDPDRELELLLDEQDADPEGLLNNLAYYSGKTAGYVSEPEFAIPLALSTVAGFFIGGPVGAGAGAKLSIARSTASVGARAVQRYLTRQGLKDVGKRAAVTGVLEGGGTVLLENRFNITRERREGEGVHVKTPEEIALEATTAAALGAGFNEVLSFGGQILKDRKFRNSLTQEEKDLLYTPEKKAADELAHQTLERLANDNADLPAGMNPPPVLGSKVTKIEGGLTIENTPEIQQRAQEKGMYDPGKSDNNVVIYKKDGKQHVIKGRSRLLNRDKTAPITGVVIDGNKHPREYAEALAEVLRSQKADTDAGVLEHLLRAGNHIKKMGKKKKFNDRVPIHPAIKEIIDNSDEKAMQGIIDEIDAGAPTPGLVLFIRVARQEKINTTDALAIYKKIRANPDAGDAFFRSWSDADMSRIVKHVKKGFIAKQKDEQAEDPIDAIVKAYKDDTIKALEVQKDLSNADVGASKIAKDQKEYYKSLSGMFKCLLGV